MACDQAKVRAALEKAFKEVDADNSQSIDASEVERVLRAFYKHKGANPSESEIKQRITEFLKDVDKNADGKVSKDEFINYFMQFFQ